MTRSPNLVLLEGPDDLHLVLHVLYAHGFERGELVAPEKWRLVRTAEGLCIELKPKGGVEKLMRDLRLELTPTFLERVAIIVDADNDLSGRWQSLRASLLHAGIEVPNDIAAEGSAFSTPGKPAIGIWLMPDNARPGYLEHWLADMIAPGDKLWSHAQMSVAELAQVEQRFIDFHRKKAEVHTWLAWQQEPGTRLAEAVVRRYVDAHCDCARALTRWFNRWLDTEAL